MRGKNFEKLSGCGIRRLMYAALIVFFASAISIAGQDKGAAEMTLKGGVIGNVGFPHALHQQAIEDCNACHSLFPQKEGAIADLQRQGKLKQQQVMNNQCLACHNERQNAGKAAGPVTCSACHNK